MTNPGKLNTKNVAGSRSVVIIGQGLVGRRCSRYLSQFGVDTELVSSRLFLSQNQQDINNMCAARDAVVICAKSAQHLPIVKRLLATSITKVVSTAGDPETINAFIDTEADLRRAQISLYPAIAASPGASTLLAHWLTEDFERVDRVTTAKYGTGGPECARIHHRSFKGRAYEVDGGEMVRKAPATGRALVWFPQPAEPGDCYRAELAEPIILTREFPTVDRIVALREANRRDRLTMKLPMLRPPHREGLIGACWVEVRGLTAHGYRHDVMAISAPLATTSALTAAALTQNLLDVDTDAGVGTITELKRHRPRIVETLLVQMHPYVKICVYSGQSELSTAPAKPRVASKNLFGYSPNDP